MPDPDFDYVQLAAKIGELVATKNRAYGNSFEQAGAILGILYPAGIPPVAYRDALCIVRIVDKLFRIANDAAAFGESPYLDIAGYGLLGAACAQTERPPSEPEHHDEPEAGVAPAAMDVPF